MTGAPLPAGADAVVPVELTDGGTTQVAIRRGRRRPGTRSGGPATTPRPATLLLADGHPARAGAARAAGGRRAGIRPGQAPAAGRRCSPPATSSSSPGTPMTPRPDPGVQQLHAGRGRPRGRRRRLPAAESCRTTPAQVLAVIEDAAGPGRPAGDQRGRQHGRRARRGQGGAGAAGHGQVPQGRDAAGHAAGLRPGRPGEHADLRLCRATRSARSCRSRSSYAPALRRAAGRRGPTGGPRRLCSPRRCAHRGTSDRSCAAS